MTEGKRARQPGPEGRSTQAPTWESRLNQQGFATEIPQSFTDRMSAVPKSKGSRDRLTGLPIEDRFRGRIARELSRSIAGGESFACLYADLDNLKVANSIGREFGDAMIKVGAATIAEHLGSIDLGNARIYAFRPGDAADETVIWMFGLTPDQLVAVRNTTAQLNRTTRVFSSDSTNFDFSTSVASVDSGSDFFSNTISEARRWIGKTQKIPWKLYKDINTYVSDRVKIIKMAKDINRLRPDALSQKKDSDEIIKVITDELGDTRISKPLLKTVLTIARDTGKLDDLASYQSRDIICQRMGIEPSMVRNFTDEELREAYYDFVLHEIYEQAGVSTE